ncbi:DUF4922 domain-containing protein [uncultured Mediterranea sp.]|uniref:DUF4922 domain-containing protein n=1 Tax=uncultured Mediterranea sp. TaxID=1926662 RepID=UPI0028049A47|nr:DUF4922 domain-containing protein [uncultured Mediterranea sp.]
MNKEVNDLLARQLATWETARHSYEALAGVRVKELNVRGVPYKVQFNPARIVSSGAKVDAKSIRERRCFLCAANRPAEQEGIPFLGHYELLVNPFPIFPRHLTVPETEHVPQLIGHRFADMLELARELTDFTVFYNGPRCGASAPDHAHFQAGNRGFMPIEADWRTRIGETVVQTDRTTLYSLNDAPRTTLVIDTDDADEACRFFQTICHALPVPEGDQEPMMNILGFYESSRWTIFVFPRAKHRPACYTAEGDARLLSSPASVDLGGVFITPVEQDFLKITADDVAQILSEVCLSPEAFVRVKEHIRNEIR